MCTKRELISFLNVGNVSLSFPGGSDGKASACNEGDLGLTPGLGRSPMSPRQEKKKKKDYLNMPFFKIISSEYL